jgi:hypothetical protein
MHLQTQYHVQTGMADLGLLGIVSNGVKFIMSRGDDLQGHDTFMDLFEKEFGVQVEVILPVCYSASYSRVTILFTVPLKGGLRNPKNYLRIIARRIRKVIRKTDEAQNHFIREEESRRMSEGDGLHYA